MWYRMGMLPYTRLLWLWKQKWVRESRTGETFEILKKIPKKVIIKTQIFLIYNSYALEHSLPVYILHILEN